MVYFCADIVQYASIKASDVVTPETLEGVGPLEVGNIVDAEIGSVGSMSVDVTERDLAFEDTDVEKSQRDD